MRIQFVSLLGTALLELGCAATSGSGTGSRPAAEFPSRKELAVLPSKAPPPSAFSTKDVVVESWMFQDAPPPDGATYLDRSPWGELVQAAAAGKTVVLSAPLRCAALELARFHLVHKALPAERLRRFMIARCGAVMPDASPLIWWQTVPPAMTEAQIVQASKDLAPQLGQALTGGPKALGFAAVKKGDRLVVAAVVGTDDVHLDPGSRTLGANRAVTLRGSTRATKFESIVGYVNQGEHGVEPCISNPRFKPPRFVITCKLAPADPFAWVELLGHEKGRFLDMAIADIIVHEGDGRGVSYSVRSSGPPSPVKDAAEAEGILVERLNRVRAAAKLAPLARAEKQSRENTRLVGTLIEAQLGHDETTADRIGRGLLAGWEVDGLIRGGHFFLGTSPTRDLTAWLDYALESPIGRLTLLDPTARQVAVGPAIPRDVAALGAAVTTYSLFESDDHAADEARVLQNLARARAAVGAPGPIRVNGLARLTEEVALVQKKGKDPFDALRDILHAAVEGSGQDVHGWVIETSDLEYLDFPPELLAQGELKVVVGVTHHRAPGAAWGQYVVFTVAIGAPPLRQAASGRLAG